MSDNGLQRQNCRIIEGLSSTYNEYSHGQVPPLKHPESPTCQAAIALCERHRDNGIGQQRLQVRALVTVVHPRDHHGKLPVVELSQAYTEAILQAIAQQEKGSGVI